MTIITNDKGLLTLTDKNKSIWVGDSELEFHKAEYPWSVKYVGDVKHYIFEVK